MTDPVVQLLTGAEAEGSAILLVVLVEDVTPETQEAAGRPPSRWRWPSKKPPRQLEGSTMMCRQNRLWK
jgi:hypothetical protein